MNIWVSHWLLLTSPVLNQFHCASLCYLYLWERIWKWCWCDFCKGLCQTSRFFFFWRIWLWVVLPPYHHSPSHCDILSSSNVFSGGTVWRSGYSPRCSWPWFESHIEWPFTVSLPPHFISLSTTQLKIICKTFWTCLWFFGSIVPDRFDLCLTGTDWTQWALCASPWSLPACSWTLCPEDLHSAGLSYKLLWEHDHRGPAVNICTQGQDDQGVSSSVITSNSTPWQEKTSWMHSRTVNRSMFFIL